MKSIDKIIDEITIEVDESYQETISKLRQQNGKCSVTDSFIAQKKEKWALLMLIISGVGSFLSTVFA